MRVMGELCAWLWGPSRKSVVGSGMGSGVGRVQPQANLAAPISPVIAARANVEEVVLPAEVALAQGLPAGSVLRRTTIDEICVVPNGEVGGGPVGPKGPQGF
jgi:hypothetical protein